MSGTRRRWWLWGIGAILVVVLAVAAAVAIPILTHQNQGLANQEPTADEWPLTATATGDDGRVRTIELSSPDSDGFATSALIPGAQIIVSGSGYDPDRGIYVAICAIPDDPSVKPGPCLGGVPSGGEQTVDEGTIQYAPSNWINDDWAWKLFGARSYDSIEDGTFTAYLVVGEPTDDKLDCTVDACGIFTRNDHTALNDRVQDLYVPVSFAG